MKQNYQQPFAVEMSIGTLAPIAASSAVQTGSIENYSYTEYDMV